MSTIDQIEIAGTLYDIEDSAARVVPITKEEYDALPDTKLTDGKLYKLTDVNSGSGGSTGVDFVPVTQEEYDNLPDTKLTDDKVYKITDADVVGDAASIKYIKSESKITDVATELSALSSNVDTLNNSLKWKHLIQINNALGKVISYPTDDWTELKIYATVNGGTNCILDATIIKDILTDKKQFISDCINVNSTTYETIIFSFSKSNFSVHSVTINGQSGDCGINIFYK